ncbi:MAG: excinuclease ABC subunit A [Deltaproteobacteria bacterium RIFCSPLOWO2_02_FULL_55_12]|nr:MAG: excinuclease ABC subunit A [Deltaproteobacteria bacterium RIFCSPLOWO2_02_FULL_55_12]
MDRIVIKGARVHNLKSIDIEIPRDKLVVITGVSGSGKSSLAFDTIYAEGQRRYVESLSVYARQFLEQMDKPDVESIEGLSPAISIEQKTTSKNPRSTVGTVTEVYDYLRLLFARVGKPHCYSCGRLISSQTIQQMADRVMELPQGSKIVLLSPIVRGRKGEYKKELESLRKDGYTKARIDGETKDLEDVHALDKRRKHYIDVIIDRLVIKEGILRRLTDSLEVAARLAGGLVKVDSLGGRELLFNEKLSCAECGISYPEINPTTFSFNSPYGACPECKGLGEKFYFDPELIIPDNGLSLREGAVAAWSRSGGKKAAGWYLNMLASLSRHYKFSLDTPYKKLPSRIKDIVLNGSGEEELEFRHEGERSKYTYTAPFEGVLGNLDRRYRETGSEDVREDLERFMNSQPCPVCEGARLKKEALFIKLDNRSIWDLTRMSIKESLKFFRSLKLSAVEQEIARRILKEVGERLGFLSNVGLDYIALDRPAATLSGGEGQRIRLATQIGSSLVGVLYILDEPSIGLHQRDNRRLLAALRRLRDMGNSVIVVEHDEETMQEADHIIDMGPGAGLWGGTVVAEGSYDEICRSDKSLTGKYLSGEFEIPVPKERKKPDGRALVIKGARANNLKDVTARFPLGLMTCVTGVSGSGKSTLVVDTLYRSLARRLYDSKARAGEVSSIAGLDYIDKVIDIDQSPIGRTPRSNPATYTGLFTPIRDLFSQLPESKARGYSPGRFSFNVKGGRCEACKGDGLIKVEMHFLPDVYVTCDVCGGHRYNRDTLEVRYKGKNISECLDLSVAEALAFFEHIPAVKEKLQTLHDVGLGYVKLGQPSTTLSGGEAQRIKLSRELSKRATGKTVYILDEPTTGLHFADIQKLLDVLSSLRETGNTIVIIEHNLDVIKSADHIIDLGPEGGDGGGRIVAEGTPEEVATVRASHTGAFLKDILRKKPV